MAARVKRLLEVDATDAFAAFCDFESVPKWVEPVVSVEVLERDTDRRATEVQFEARDGEGGTIRYSLRYSYDVPGRRIMWRPSRNPESGIHGVVEFEPITGGCQMVYTVRIGETWAENHSKAKAVATAVADAFTCWIAISRR